MERVKKWCQAHQKACLITGIIGMLLSPFLWPLFLAVIVQSLTLGLPIAAGIYCYKYLNEKKENPNENDEQKHSHPETKKPGGSSVSVQELRKEQARNLRYKKPIAKGLNWQDIWDDLYEMYEGCTLVIWFMDDDKETLLESLNDDESEAEEYKIAFSTLEADCDQLMAALQEEWIPECFNLFFVAAQAGEYLGYDIFERDYFGIDGEETWAEDVAKEKLMRLTKEELIASVRQCFNVYRSYVGLRYRYDNLTAAMSFIKGEHVLFIKIIKNYPVFSSKI